MKRSTFMKFLDLNPEIKEHFYWHDNFEVDPWKDKSHFYFDEKKKKWARVGCEPQTGPKFYSAKYYDREEDYFDDVYEIYTDKSCSDIKVVPLPPEDLNED